MMAMSEKAKGWTIHFGSIMSQFGKRLSDAAYSAPDLDVSTVPWMGRERISWSGNSDILSAVEYRPKGGCQNFSLFSGYLGEVGAHMRLHVLVQT
jgi:hypothetical protein